MFLILLISLHAVFSNAAPGICMMEHCASEYGKCIIDPKCTEAINCNIGCSIKGKNVDRCNLLCELNYGYDNKDYIDALQCSVDHHCFPIPKTPDGVCLVKNNSDPRLDKSITSVADVEGQWWILKGLNCGQNATWPAGFDWLPCQYDNFVLSSNKTWIDHIGYCGGQDNKCSTKMVHTVADVSVHFPGVLTHNYTDPPLKPQNEEWKILAKAGDWMLYIYCGYTPMGAYAGASVVVRQNVPGDGKSHPNISYAEIPPTVEQLFRQKARTVGIDYDHDWCDSDVRGCTYNSSSSLTWT